MLPKCSLQCDVMIISYNYYIHFILVFCFYHKDMNQDDSIGGAEERKTVPLVDMTEYNALLF